MCLFSGYDSWGQWAPRPNVYPACRTDALPPATIGAQRGALFVSATSGICATSQARSYGGLGVYCDAVSVSAGIRRPRDGLGGYDNVGLATTGSHRDSSHLTSGPQETSWRSREFVRVDDEIALSIGAARTLDLGQVRGHDEVLSQVGRSQRGAASSVSNPCVLPTTSVRNYGDRDIISTLPMVGQLEGIIPASGLVVQQPSLSGARQSVQTRSFGDAEGGRDVHRSWRDFCGTSPGVRVMSPETANAATLLMEMSAAPPGRSQEELQRDVTSNQVLVQPSGTAGIEAPPTTTTAGRSSLLDRYQDQIAALQEEMTSLRRQVAAECGYATDWSELGSANLRSMAVAPTQVGQPTPQRQGLLGATTVQIPTSIPSIGSVASFASVVQPVTATATTTRPSETTTLGHHADTLKSPLVAEERRSTKAVSSERRKRRRRSRQRSESNRVRDSTSDSSTGDEQEDTSKGAEGVDKRRKVPYVSSRETDKASEERRRDDCRIDSSYRGAWRDNRDALLCSSSDTSDEEESCCERRDKGERGREGYSDRSRRRKTPRERSSSVAAGVQRRRSQSSDVSSSRTRRHHIKIEPYDGTTSVEVFLLKFEKVAKHNRWSRSTKSTNLFNSLKGAAEDMFAHDFSNLTYKYITKKLLERFGAHQQHEVFRAQLRKRSRKPDESIPALQGDIERLVALAYPTANLETRDDLALEAFQDALNDEIQDRVRDKDPQTLSSAVKAALRVEASLKTSEVRHQDKKPRNVRKVQEEDRNELPPTHFDGPADQPRSVNVYRRSGEGGSGQLENFQRQKKFQQREQSQREGRSSIANRREERGFEPKRGEKDEGDLKLKDEVNRMRSQMTDLENQLRGLSTIIFRQNEIAQQQATSSKYNPPSAAVSASPSLAPQPSASESTLQEQFSPTIRCYTDTRASSWGTPRGSALIVVNILRLTRPDGLAYKHEVNWNLANSTIQYSHTES